MSITTDCAHTYIHSNSFYSHLFIHMCVMREQIFSLKPITLKYVMQPHLSHFLLLKQYWSQILKMEKTLTFMQFSTPFNTLQSHNDHKLVFSLPKVTYYAFYTVWLQHPTDNSLVYFRILVLLWNLHVSKAECSLTTMQPQKSHIKSM